VFFVFVGKTDLLAFRRMGLSKDGYIDNVDLALTNVTTNTPVYYVTVKAVNGAGKESSVMSSRYNIHTTLYCTGIILLCANKHNIYLFDIENNICIFPSAYE